MSANCITISADHTYKTCKYLKTFTKEKQKVGKYQCDFFHFYLHLLIHLPQVKILAQLFDVVDNCGNVIVAQIVPDGSHSHIANCIQQILPFQSKDALTKAFYSDKAVADQNLCLIFSDFYMETFGLTNWVTEILQGTFSDCFDRAKFKSNVCFPHTIINVIFSILTFFARIT